MIFYKTCNTALQSEVTRAPHGAREFVIPGAPVPKPRQTQRDKWLDPPRLGVANYRAWADVARAIAPLDALECLGPITLSAQFFMSIPGSWSKKKRLESMGQPALGRPDLDNFLKALTDSLWPEADSFVWRFEACEKRYEDSTGPRTIVRWNCEKIMTVQKK